MICARGSIVQGRRDMATLLRQWRRWRGRQCRASILPYYSQGLAVDKMDGDDVCRFASTDQDITAVSRLGVNQGYGSSVRGRRRSLL